MERKRPIGISALAIVLWILTAAALLGTFAVPDHGPAFTSAFLAYAVSAAVAGYALWRQRTWAVVAFAVWSVAVLVNGIMVDVFFNFGPTLRGVTFLAGTAASLALGCWYVRKNTIVGA